MSTPRPDAATEESVVAPAFFVEQLRLIGIVDGRSALLTDPEQVGWTVRPGALVGRAEARSCWAPWRVETIEQTNIVLVRVPQKGCAGEPIRRRLSLEPTPGP